MFSKHRRNLWTKPRVLEKVSAIIRHILLLYRIEFKRTLEKITNLVRDFVFFTNNSMYLTLHAGYDNYLSNVSVLLKKKSITHRFSEAFFLNNCV